MPPIYEHDIVLHTLLLASSDQYRAKVQQDLSPARFVAPAARVEALKSPLKRRKPSKRKQSKYEEFTESEDGASQVGSFGGLSAAASGNEDEGCSQATTEDEQEHDPPADKVNSKVIDPPKIPPPANRFTSNHGPPVASSSRAPAVPQRIRPTWAHVTPMRFLTTGDESDDEAGTDGASPVPVKRARGRPKKIQTDLQGGSELVDELARSSPAAAAQSTALVAPKKRGRPRKSVSEAAPAEASEAPAHNDEGGAGQPIKRKRGRPRKSVPEDAPAGPSSAFTSKAEGGPDQPVKRGRGRPRKSASEPVRAEASSAEPPKVAVEAEQPVKRGRGRPRKSAPEPVPVEASSAEPPNGAVEAEQPSKRGRGRPRKSLPEPHPQLAEAIDASGPALPVKRGRGRPRKSLVEPSTAPVPAQFDLQEIMAADPPIKRKPGRPRKSVPEASQPTASSSRVEEASANDPPIKRGRGRPRKSVPEAAPMRDESVADEQEQTDQPPKRKRGRPKKAQVLEPDEPIDLSRPPPAAAHEDEATEADEDDAPPPKRNRLGPRKSLLTQALDVFRSASIAITGSAQPEQVQRYLASQRDGDLDGDERGADGPGAGDSSGESWLDAAEVDELATPVRNGKRARE